MRTTKVEVIAVFKLWVAAINGDVGVMYNNVGGYQLDHSSVYGGYVISRICNPQGGVSHPLGNNRLPAYYFVQALRMSMRSLEEMRLNTHTRVK